MGALAVREAPNPTVFRMQEAYRWVREVVAGLSEEQLRWQPNPTTPSIRFHLFHIARCADDLNQLLTGADQQVWHAEVVSTRWGLDSAGLGLGENGAMVGDDIARALPLPGREELLAYCDRVLVAADGALAAIGDEQMRQTRTGADGHRIVVGEGIADQLSHTARHLGMIECLRGMQGLRGTATV